MSQELVVIKILTDGYEIEGDNYKGTLGEWASNEKDDGIDEEEQARLEQERKDK